MTRIKEGFVLARNPMNPHQISRISLLPDVVDGIVFWTKNPAPMLDKLTLLKEYMYYFQFTVTSYGNKVELNLPKKNTEIINTFKQLSDIIGADRVIWRYDPIFVSDIYTIDYHVRAFEIIANLLKGYTKKVTISFIDYYRNITNNIKPLNLRKFPESEQCKLAELLAKIAQDCGLSIDTCAEKIDLKRFGIEHARCIDDRLFEKLLDCSLNVEKDKNQRLECGCIASIDIGAYNTCRNGCLYCYANHSAKQVEINFSAHDVNSPLLTGGIEHNDIIKERDVKSYIDIQMKLVKNIEDAVYVSLKSMAVLRRNLSR
jgi:hypothetical protein